jgi:rhodanese-related sulfurtransferase
MNRPVFLLLAAFCSLTGRTEAQTALPSFSVREAHDAARADKIVLVDIRTPEEWADTGVPQGAIRLDMTGSAFEVRLAALRLENPGKPIALICRTGSRTSTLQRKLAGRGWRDLIDVRGGMLGTPKDKGWLAEKLPVTP